MATAVAAVEELKKTPTALSEENIEENKKKQKTPKKTAKTLNKTHTTLSEESKEIFLSFSQASSTIRIHSI